MADNTDDATKGAVAANDAPVPPQIIVQMMQPTAGEPTVGLDTQPPKGSYFVWVNEDGKQVKKRVNAEGQPVKSK